MTNSLLQFERHGTPGVCLLDHDGRARILRETASILQLAGEAIGVGQSLAQLAQARATIDVDLVDLQLNPVTYGAEPGQVLVSGTGLTHLGSAEGRDAMHKAAAAGATTDSMRMFLDGLAGGKPADEAIGVQPEWFYKGDGSILVGPDATLSSPGFAQDGSEEPEIAGIYLIDPAGQPVRLGFVLGNEFSDHVTERYNYLFLAHSKLRPAAIGAELLLGELPADVRGTSKIMRDNATIWEKPFLSGEANMSHSIANLEHHHFKYAPFRRPATIHVHFFGTATLSFSDGVRTQADDVFEIAAAPFRLPLRNRLIQEAEGAPVRCRAL